MSSKFFTWTKGDRKVAEATLRSGTVESLPVEYITLNGIDYFRAAQETKNKTSSAPFFPTQPHYSDPAALQDAAVTSATSLLTVVNDLLRSPHISAHLSAQQGLDTMPGRGRSNTAPPTPHYGPVQSELAELPGSCVPKTPLILGRTSLDYQSSRVKASALHDDLLPLSNQSEWNSTGNVRKPSLTFHADDFAPNDEPIPRQPSVASQATYCRSPGQISELCDSIEITSPKKFQNDADGTHLDMAPPQSSDIPCDDQVLGSYSSAISALNSSSSYSSKLETSVPTPKSPNRLSSDDGAQYRSMQSVLNQVASMRNVQEESVTSLQEAHRREIDMHRSYITSLEQRCGLTSTFGSAGSKQQLTIDTSQLGGRGLEPSSQNTSATTMQSFESLIQSHRRASQDAIAENEALKRALVEARKTEAEIASIRDERDQLRAFGEKNHRRIVQLRDIVKKTKSSEKTWMNAARDFEARLEVANMQRLDALQGIEDAHEQIQRLNRTDSHQHYGTSDTSASSSRSSNTARDSASEKAISVTAQIGPEQASPNQSRSATLSDQIEKLKEQLSNRDTTIRELELQSSSQPSEVSELKRTISSQKEMLEKLRADCEQYNTLLHNELRRQSRKIAQRSSDVPPSIQAQVSAAVAKKVSSLATSDRSELQPSGHQEAIALLEKELEHSFTEIILYKRDIKAYQKDLRNAEERIKIMEASRRPPTPDTESQTSDSVSSSVERPRFVSSKDSSKPQSSGLGISLHNTINNTPSTFGATQPNVPAPPHRPLTPSNNPSPKPAVRVSTIDKDKELPRPPTSTVYNRTPKSTSSSPPPISRNNRNDGLRSLSETMVPSYMRRRRPTSPSPCRLGSLPNSLSSERATPTRQERVGSLPVFSGRLSSRSSPLTRASFESSRVIHTPPPRIV